MPANSTVGVIGMLACIFARIALVGRCMLVGLTLVDALKPRRSPATGLTFTLLACQSRAIAMKVAALLIAIAGVFDEAEKVK